MRGGLVAALGRRRAATPLLVSHVASGGMAFGTTNPIIPYPAGIAAGDMLVMSIAWRDSTLSISPPGGWASVDLATGGKGTDGVDSGPVRVRMYTKVADGTETGNLAITASSTAHVGEMSLYRKTGGTWSIGVASGSTSDNPPVTVWTVDMGTEDVAANDMVILASAINGNVFFSPPSNPNVYMVGLPGSPVALGNDRYLATSAGNDLSLHVAEGVLSGGATGSLYYEATFPSVSGNTPSGPTVFCRLRAV